jgi:hypothetical protein
MALYIQDWELKKLAMNAEGQNPSVYKFKSKTPLGIMFILTTLINWKC